MKTDFYTKAVLTVIAIMLTIIVVKDFTIQQATAGEYYDCDVCDQITTIENNVDYILSKVDEIESNTFGSMCGPCPQ